VPFLGQGAANWSQHLVADLCHLYLEFPIGGVLERIRQGCGAIDIRIVQSCPNLAGKEKGAANAHRANGIKLVRVKKNTRLQASGNMPASVAVATNTVADGFNISLAVCKVAKNRFRQLRTTEGMTDLSLALALLFTTDIVQERGRDEDIKTGEHLLPDRHSRGQNAFTVIRPMGATLGDGEGMADCAKPREQLLTVGQGMHVSGVQALRPVELLHQPAQGKQQQFFVIAGNTGKLGRVERPIERNAAFHHVHAELIQVIERQGVLIQLLA